MLDYAKIGLKVGIEIHQQLEGKKLFCSCQTLLRDEQPHFTVKRFLRPVPGEHGEIDVAALHEQLKGMRFLYEGYHDTTCLVELDEEPPHLINEEALRIATQVSLMAKAKIADVVQVMRKTIIDGSNTSGFQRTALIARNGFIETKHGKIQIENISLEEDSCRIIKEEQNKTVFRLDRLGIPLIEIGTAPDIKTPEQCMEAAEYIGMLLRSTRKVRRGLGTIRQDVNVSVAGGTRVEIKGAQELRLLPLLVEYEAQRQLSLIEIHNKVKKIKDYDVGEIIDLTGIFENTESKLIKGVLEKRGKVFGARLVGFAGIVGKEVQPGRRFGTELSDYAKIHGAGGIIHSDEDLNKYKFSEDEIAEIKKRLQMQPNDAFIIVADQEAKARKALDAAITRANTQINTPVPAEVRRANPDGTTSFLRPMPGAARMYPETDIPFVYPETKGIALPKLLSETAGEVQSSYALAPDLAEQIAFSDRYALFEELAQKHREIKPAYIAEMLTATMTELKRDYQIDPNTISGGQLRMLFGYLAQGKLHKDVMLDALIDVAKGKFDISWFASISTEEVHKELEKIVKENPGAPFSALMGIAMQKLRTKASGKKIADMLQEILGNHKSMKGQERVNERV